MVLSLMFGVAFRCRELDEIQAGLGRYLNFDQIQSHFVRIQSDREMIVISFSLLVVYLCYTFCRLHLPPEELSKLIKLINIQWFVE